MQSSNGLSRPSAAVLALAGFAALAVAMGIGRFAFTPLLPMMQQDAGLSLAQGGWLASANYLGYFIGAIVAGLLPWRAATQLRIGLFLVVTSTALMGIGAEWFAWLIWRFLAGLTSAMVLVGTASLCLKRLADMGQPHKAGIIFAGVGAGIAIAGLLCLFMSLLHISSSSAWLILALSALAGTAIASVLWRDRTSKAKPWPAAVSKPASDANPTENMPEPSLQRGPAGKLEPEPEPEAKPASGYTGSVWFYWRFILAYGTFGFGYILPATFLPAQARELVTDPAIFGLAWPLFGAAAALSTLLTSRLAQRYARRKIWLVSQLVMAIGVLLPALWSSIAAIVLASLCVGGTFMIITMTGMQESNALGGRNPQKLTAAITAAFAAGQLAGPVVFAMLHQWMDISLDGALILGFVILLLGGLLLLRPLDAALSAQRAALPFSHGS
ncbi:YbfB/YjiJ family MFS transporter [Allopusillimonas soli]|uniref:YbfB/YjiJ family MFS transporter n=1 Tax=Allopusillimonas soli TaxID=659016 RepID=A0A853F8Y2_9BURK|nr:YbfB/YjiJ family MFS transporter [Allopusillimonas soli]NYT36553.1 YbfB/YjiJ family MFS transporter [Allopusillimonas soli]